MHLYWLRSPVMVGEGRQWTMRAVFQRSDRSLVDVKCPWGMLPYLRVGAAYKDGSMFSLDSVGSKMKLYLNRHAQATVVTARQALTKRQYPLDDWRNYNENCVVMEVPRFKVVVPCIEVIRAFFVLNRYTAQEILKPTSFTDIPMELAGSTVRMHFQTISQHRSLTAEVKKVIALSNLDPTWSESWRRVWHKRNQRYRTDYAGKNYIPLECVPPVFSNCTWKVRAIRFPQTFFVYEIRGFSVPHNYPFSEIECWCETPDTSNNDGGLSRIPVLDAGETVKADQSGAAPKNPKQPIHIEIDAAEHSFRTSPQFSEVKVKRPALLSQLNTGQKYEIKRTAGGQSLIVSLNEQAATADTCAAEFMPYSETTSIPDEFKRFFRAIDEMRKLMPLTQITYEFADIPEKSMAAKDPASGNRYALVTVDSGSRSGYILELGERSRQVSTVLFWIDDQLNDKKSAANSMLLNCMTTSAAWDVEALRRVEAIVFYLAKHTKCSYQHWAERLKKKMIVV